MATDLELVFAHMHPIACDICLWCNLSKAGSALASRPLQPSWWEQKLRKLLYSLPKLIAYEILSILTQTLVFNLKEQKCLQDCIPQVLTAKWTVLCKRRRRIDPSSSKDQLLELFFCMPGLGFDDHFPSPLLTLLLPILTLLLFAKCLGITGVGQEDKELNGDRIDGDTWCLTLLRRVRPILYKSCSNLNILVASFFYSIQRVSTFDTSRSCLIHSKG